MCVVNFFFLKRMCTLVEGSLGWEIKITWALKVGPIIKLDDVDGPEWENLGFEIPPSLGWWSAKLMQMLLRWGTFQKGWRPFTLFLLSKELRRKGIFVLSAIKRKWDDLGRDINRQCCCQYLRPARNRKSQLWPQPCVVTTSKTDKELTPS